MAPPKRIFSIEQKQEQQQEQQQPQQRRQQQRIYGPTYGIKSSKTAVVYQRNFNRFLKHIKIHGLEVLLDFNQKIIKEMIIDYIVYLRDERKITNRSIKVHLSAILRFFQNNNDDFNLRISNFDIHLPPDESVNEDRPYNVEEIGQILQGQSADLRSKIILEIS